MVLYDVIILAVTGIQSEFLEEREAIGVQLSFTLIAFSTFIFFIVWLAKKDIPSSCRLINKAGLISRGREYYIEDLHLLQVME